jgi:hypothetical protein
MDEAKVEVLG